MYLKIFIGIIKVVIECVINGLTSVDKGIHVFNFPDGGMITISHQGLYSVQQTVNIDYRPVRK